MYTQTITVKLDKSTHQQLASLAKNMDAGKSKVVRMAIEDFVKKKSSGVGESLIKMAEDAKKYKYKAPKDVVENLNKYLYGKA